MKKKQYRYKYTFNVTKRMASYTDVYDDEYFTVSVYDDESEVRRAKYRVEKMLEADAGSSSSYKFGVKLDSIEEVL